MAQISPDERLTRVCKILLKGIYQLQLEECSQVPSDLSVPTKKREYTVREAARILGMSRRSLQRWIAQEKIIPHRKSNGYPVFNDEELSKIVVLKRSKFYVPSWGGYSWFTKRFET